ncbi:mitochondrial import inner membrane translocase subunit Tim10 B isoform X2 [Gouania willdenowi]|nr:mitochondrial import inner membrane translocase subunit Tim10 B isoform X2 [Gouania willdenowi]
MMSPDQQLRNLRDFLMVYNRMTEVCFQRCSSNFNYRYLTMDEEGCVDNCAGKLIRSNHRLMNTYVQLMPKMVQRRMEEMESKAVAAAAAAEAGGASESAGITTSEAPPSFPAPPTSSLAPPADDASIPTSAGLNTAVAEDQSSYITQQATPVADSGHAPMLSKPDSGLSLAAELPLPPPVGSAQVDSGSSTPVFAPSKPTSISEDALVLTPAVSDQEKSP